MARLENQTVLITWCSSGIGRALAKEFAAAGHRVAATARQPESIEDLAGDRVHPLDLDELRTQFETIVVGVVAVVWAVAPQMVARWADRVVNIGSVSG